MTITCTYDHRIIQGAESGAFLGKLQALLDGEDGFYEEIFDHLRMPHLPVRWETDRNTFVSGRGAAQLDAEIAKEAGVIQMINAYRVRGHLIADLDPLGAEPSYHPELDPETYGLTIWDLDREFLTGTLGEAIGARGPSHAARDSGNAAPDLLRQDRLRVHEHPGAGAETLAAAAHGAGSQQLAARSKEVRLRMLRDLVNSRRVRALSALALRRPEALRARRRGNRALPSWKRSCERAADHNVHEIVIGMAHRGRLNMLANALGNDVKQIFSEFEGDRSRQHAGLGRREVSPGRQRRAQIRKRPRNGGLGRAQPQPSGSRGSGGRRHRAPQAGRRRRRRTASASSRCWCTATPLSPARAWWRRR